MTHVKLMGELGEKFGSEWHMSATKFRDIFKLIDCQTEGFKKYILDSAEKGIDFTVLNGEDLIEDGLDLHLLSPKDTVVITPVASGAGASDVVKVIVGAILFWYGYQYLSQFLPGGTGAGGPVPPPDAPGMTTSLHADMTRQQTIHNMARIGIQSLGVGLMMSGVTGYLTPDSPSEAGDSYLFDGPQNNVKQGVPVPICYGQLIVGGAVMNFGFVEDRVDNIVVSGYDRVTASDDSPPGSWEGETGGTSGDDTGNSGHDNKDVPNQKEHQSGGGKGQAPGGGKGGGIPK